MKKLIRNIKAKYYELKMKYWQGKVRKYLGKDDRLMTRYSIDMYAIYNTRLLEL